MSREIYLPVDSNYDDYQLIHLDILNNFGIACKFKFDPNKPNNFNITHIKKIEKKFDGKETDFIVNITEDSKPASPSVDYGYIISIKTTTNPSNNDDDFRVNNGFKHMFKMKKKNLKKENKIDVHFDQEKLINPEIKFLLPSIIATTFGTEFCKFYII